MSETYQAPKMARFTNPDTGVSITIAATKNPPVGFEPAPDLIPTPRTPEQELENNIQLAMPGAFRERQAWST